jgi:arylsulfatase A-like enzyme
MSRHFVWLIPLTDLAIFLVLGAVFSVLAWSGRDRDRWLATRLLGALTVLPPFWVAFPRISGPAGFLLALGVAARLVPVLESYAAVVQRLVRVSFPVVAGIVPLLTACLWGSDRIRAWREAMLPLPPPGSPNVLLIVLDAVGAGHLGLYGYECPTSPTLEGLARRGIRFDRAQATASWTLPSHASLFTGRWPHELSAGWITPLDEAYPTLAEFLGSRGYATAGFIANAFYCGSDSGLARGFTAYRDYIFPRLTAFKTALLVNRPLEGVVALDRFLEDWLDFDLLGPTLDRLWRLVENDRKAAVAVNGEFLDWLSRRRQPERPFFAFLNYFDAHYPYELPERGIHRFGDKPRTTREATLLRDWRRLIDKGPSPDQIRFARDAYDDCVADLDERLGRLIDELERRAILGRTWVIVTADHGERFGEQAGVFWHGTSLYQAQLHVPLVIVPPAGGPPPQVVTAPVSLRDLAATIVDVAGFRADSPFPGAPLARFWDGSSPAATASPGPASPAVNPHGPAPRATQPAAPDPVLSEVVPLPSVDPDPARWLKKPRWPLAALTDDDWTYIRREEKLREELFDLRQDAQQRHNLARDPAMQPVLERMRKSLDRITAGPLTPQRFPP